MVLMMVVVAAMVMMMVVRCGAVSGLVLLLADLVVALGARALGGPALAASRTIVGRRPCRLGTNGSGSTTAAVRAIVGVWMSGAWIWVLVVAGRVW